MTRRNIHLPDPQYEQLQALSVVEDISVAEIIRRAIDEYLVNHGNDRKKKSN